MPLLYVVYLIIDILAEALDDRKNVSFEDERFKFVADLPQYSEEDEIRGNIG